MGNNNGELTNYYEEYENTEKDPFSGCNEKKIAQCFDAFIVYADEFFSLPPRVFRHILSDLRYLGPLRDSLDDIENNTDTDLSSSWASGIGAWNYLKQASEVELQNVNSWLGKDLGLNFGFYLKQDKHRRINNALAEDIVEKIGGSVEGKSEEEIKKEVWSLINQFPVEPKIYIIPDEMEIELMPKDVGTGVAQVMPVIVTAILNNSCLAIEQPELHLHPRLQAELGDLFAESATLNDNTLLLETHSEHLILRILRRIREKNDGELPEHLPEFGPDDLSVYYIEQSETGTKATRLRVDETGEFIDEWPNGFFEERAEELF